MGPRAGLDGGKYRPTGVRSPDLKAIIPSQFELWLPSRVNSCILIFLMLFSLSIDRSVSEGTHSSHSVL